MNQPVPASLTLSIVIVAYRSQADLERCLPTIQSQQTSFRYEIIIVNNDQSDRLDIWLSERYSSIRLLENPVNDGYAGGNNLGLQRALGQWTLFLNPDTELWPDALERLVSTARQFPDALITPKLLNPDGTINACGNQMHYTGITTCRYLNQPTESCTACEPIPLLSGAALLGKTAVFRQLGGFDPLYFMYFEDTDLSLRARLAGYALLCEARAVVTHHYKLGMSQSKFYYLERNRLLTFMKLFSGSTLKRLLPALLVTELLTWGYSLRGLSYIYARFQTYTWLWKHRREIRQRRQALPKSGDLSLLDGALNTLPFGQVTNGQLGNWINRLTAWLYKALRPE